MIQIPSASQRLQGLFETEETLAAVQSAFSEISLIEFQN